MEAWDKWISAFEKKNINVNFFLQFLVIKIQDPDTDPELEPDLDPDPNPHLR